MATQKVDLTGDFVKVNNGGLVDTSGCMIICKSDYIIFGTTDKDTTPPIDDNCFIVKDVINYSGSDDVYIKARNQSAIVIVDSI